jgi:hypothetical protein
MSEQTVGIVTVGVGATTVEVSKLVSVLVYTLSVAVKKVVVIMKVAILLHAVKRT